MITSVPEVSSINSAVSTEHRLVTDRQTDRHPTALCIHVSCGKKINLS